jgi:hypothetical protein
MTEENIRQGCYRNIPLTITSTASSGERPCAISIFMFHLTTLPIAASCEPFSRGSADSEKYARTPGKKNPLSE